MIVKDLAHTYPTATGRELQQAMVEGSPHLHERKAGHVDDYVDDYTRRTARKAWESLGREPEPWMRAEGGRGGSQGQGLGRGSAGGISRAAATLLEALIQEQGHPDQGHGAERDDLDGGNR